MENPSFYVLLAAAAILMAGCRATAFTNTQRIRYEGMDFRVIIAEQDRVDRHCKKRGARLTDRGEPVGRIACCADKKRRTIWASWEHLTCLFHEICHLTGKSNLECDKVHVRP